MKTRMVVLATVLLATVTSVWSQTSTPSKAESLPPVQVQGSLPEVLSVAVFDFESRDEAVHDLGPKVATLISAQLSADPRVITVERAELDKLLGEQELGLSGTIDPATAAKVGHLTGAKVLVTGRVFTSGRETFVVAKVIGTETSRVYGEVVRGVTGDSIADMSAEMAKRIGRIIEVKGETLVAKVEKPEDLIARLQKMVPAGKLPTVSVSIIERHIGSPTIDPAAETEVSFILQKLGFTIADENKRTDVITAVDATPHQVTITVGNHSTISGVTPDIEITGEGFSEFGMRKGNLVSCRARVEIKATDRATGRILFVDRQSTVAVDLSEHLAGKTALQDAAAKLTERMLPQLLK